MPCQTWKRDDNHSHLHRPCSIAHFPSTPSEPEERPAFPYISKRDKAMPWTLKGGSRCDLFDYRCAEKERAALKASLEAAAE